MFKRIQKRGASRVKARLSRVESLESRSLLAFGGPGLDGPGRDGPPPPRDPDTTYVLLVTTDARGSETLADQRPNLAHFSVTRFGPTDAALVVNYSIDGTATNGADYETLSGSVEIPAGRERVDIEVRPIDDDEIEEPETVYLSVLPDPAYEIVPTFAPAFATIHSNDPVQPAVPVVSIRSPDPLAAETAADQRPNTGALVVHRHGPTDAALVVNLTIEGTATNGADYETIAETVEIPAGESSAEIIVRPIDDDLVERLEIVRVSIAASGDASYRVNPHGGSARVGIGDNDRPPPLPLVSFRHPDPVAVEPHDDREANTGTVLVHRSGPTDAALLVRYSIGGTATNGVDYETIADTVEIPAGSSTAEIVIRPLADDEEERLEGVRLHLQPDAAYHVNRFGSHGGVVIFDNEPRPTNTGGVSNGLSSDLGQGVARRRGR